MTFPRKRRPMPAADRGPWTFSAPAAVPPPDPALAPGAWPMVSNQLEGDLGPDDRAPGLSQLAAAPVEALPTCEECSQ